MPLKIKEKKCRNKNQELINKWEAKMRRSGADRTAPATGATSRRHWTPSCITQRLFKTTCIFLHVFHVSINSRFSQNWCQRNDDCIRRRVKRTLTTRSKLSALLLFRFRLWPTFQCHFVHWKSTESSEKISPAFALTFFSMTGLKPFLKLENGFLIAVQTSTK